MKVKKKGAYMGASDRQPHQNVSKMCVPQAAEQWFLNNVEPKQYYQTLMKKSKAKDFNNPEDDPKFLFMISTKVPRSSRLVTCPAIVHGYDYDNKDGYDKLPALREIKEDSFEQEMSIMYISGNKQIHLGDETEQNRVARYHVSTCISDPFLIKIMPPLETKSEAGERLFNLEAGYHVNMCTKASDFDWSRVNFEYYIKEAEKLINLPVRSINDL